MRASPGLILLLVDGSLSRCAASFRLRYTPSVTSPRSRTVQVLGTKIKLRQQFRVLSRLQPVYVNDATAKWRLFARFICQRPHAYPTTAE